MLHGPRKLHHAHGHNYKQTQARKVQARQHTTANACRTKTALQTAKTASEQAAKTLDLNPKNRNRMNSNELQPVNSMCCTSVRHVSFVANRKWCSRLTHVQVINA